MAVTGEAKVASPVTFSERSFVAFQLGFSKRKLSPLVEANAPNKLNATFFSNDQFTARLV